MKGSAQVGSCFNGRLSRPAFLGVAVAGRLRYSALVLSASGCLDLQSVPVVVCEARREPDLSGWLRRAVPDVWPAPSVRQRAPGAPNRVCLSTECCF
jgi:hypothetical protein